ncbi:MAG: MATE family efflux transporter [Sphingomonadales bacterium]|nr:MATE family efflux transporter [Sphingomonadales bacterium]
MAGRFVPSPRLPPQRPLAHSFVWRHQRDVNEATPITASGESETSRRQVPPRTGRAVIRGDLTQGPILKALVLFTVPALATNLMQSVGGSINAIWVGQLLGTTAVAATANANMIMFLVFGTVFGFGMATTIMVGKHFGARDIDAARRAFGGGIGFCTGLAMIIATLGWIFAPSVLGLLATPPQVKTEALAYLRITLVSMPFMSMSMMIGMGVRGAGDATTPMMSSVVATSLGVMLNPLLIRGISPIPAFGIAGSAIAGTIAAVCGTTVTIVLIYARDLPLRLKGRELLYLLPTREEVRYMMVKGLPMGGQTMISTAAGLIFVGLVNREGLLATAAYGASMQLWNYIQMPAMAVGQAISTMVAQNIGARQHNRVARITWTGLAVTQTLTLVVTILILLFDEPVLGLFLGHASPAVPLARHIQYICIWTYLMSGFMMVLAATMRAYGSVLVPLAIMVIALYPTRLGFYFAARPHIGGEAVWWSYPAGSVVMLALSLLAWRYGPWRKAQQQAMAAP